MLIQVDSDGFKMTLMEEVVDHKVDVATVTAEQHVVGNS